MQFKIIEMPTVVFSGNVKIMLNSNVGPVFIIHVYILVHNKNKILLIFAIKSELCFHTKRVRPFSYKNGTKIASVLNQVKWHQIKVTSQWIPPCDYNKCIKGTTLNTCGGQKERLTNMLNWCARIEKNTNTCIWTKY